MMKNKNGFVFVETMIVVVVLVTALLIIYSSYTGLITIERRRVRYDDPAFIYKTKAISDFLNSLYDEDGNVILRNKIKQQDSKFIVISTEDIELFGDLNSNRQNFFSSMYSAFNVHSIILINKKQIENLKKEEISTDFYNYVRSIDTSEDGEDQFYFIVMYAEKVNGDACNANELINAQSSSNNKTENKCTFYYSSIKINEGAS